MSTSIRATVRFVVAPCVVVCAAARAAACVGAAAIAPDAESVLIALAEAPCAAGVVLVFAVESPTAFGLFEACSEAAVHADARMSASRLRTSGRRRTRTGRSGMEGE